MIKRKHLVIGTGIILLLMVIGIALSPTPSWDGKFPDAITSIPMKEYSMSADGDKWLIGWGYRQSLSITGSSGADVDYQIELTVEYGTGSSSGAIVYCESNSQNDFDDIRFTDGDGESELSYWRQEYTANDDATFWVEISDDLGTTRTIYIYYGNAGASTTSNGETTFLFFDDFENNNFNRWDTAEDNWIITAEEKYGIYAAIGDADASGRTLDWSFASARTDDFMVHSYLLVNDIAGTRYTMHGVESNSDAVYIADMRNNDWQVYNGAWVTYELNTISSSTWYRVEIGIDFTNGRYRPYIDGTEKTTQYLLDSGGNAVADILTLQSVTSNVVSDDQYLDDWFVRNWQYSEPTPNTWGSEEEQVSPVNAATPVCTNLDDTDNLYADYRTYVFTSNVTDANGYTDIDYVRLSNYDTGSETLRWTIQYSQESNVFSEVADASNLIVLNTGSSLYTKSGNAIDITWHLTVSWIATPYVNSDDDLKQWVKDFPNPVVSTEYDSNYDYITKVAMSGEALVDGSGTDNRGDYDTVGGITASGTLVYWGSSTHRPATSEIDVWVTCPDTPDTDWHATNYESSGGTFSVLVDSDNEIGSDTYTFKVVMQDAGSGGTDFASVTNTASYIADQIQVQSYSVSDARDNINENVNIDVTLDYDHDDTDVTTGTVTINGYPASHQGSGVWRITRTSASVTAITYNTVAVSGDAHGITIEDQNGQSQQVIWDRIYAVSLSYGGDTRINVGTSVNFDYELHYDYDESDVTDGTIAINGEGFTHQGSGVWRHTNNGGDSVGDITFDSIVASGNTHGITVTTTDSNDVTLIWDRVQAQSITGATDRCDVDSNTFVNFLLWYDYDNTQMTDGTVTLEGVSANHQGSGVWRISTSSATVQLVTYDIITATGNTHGITSVDMNSKSDTIIFDRIKILTTSATNNYMEYGTGTTTFNVTAELEYDNHALGSGDTLYMNGTSMTWDTDHFYIVFGPYSEYSIWSLFVNSTNANEATYGITVINLNGQSDNVRTDRIVLTVTMNQQWTVVNYNTTIAVTGVYQYSGWTWNGTATFNGADNIYPTESAYGNYTYTVQSITDPDEGYTTFTANDIWCVFDNAEVSSASYYWIQYSIDSVWLMLQTGTWTWSFNGTTLNIGTDVNCVLQSEMNNTNDDWAIVDGTGDIGDLIIGPFDSTWYHAQIDIMCKTTIDGISYDWEVWTVTLDVDIMHSIHIEDSGMDIQDNWITFYFHTNWNNATFYIWDNSSLVGSSLEGWYQIAKPSAVGLHNYTILINGTQGTITDGEQNKDFSVSDSWVWMNFKYTINPVTLSITDLLVQQNNISIVLSGFIYTPSLSMTWEAFEHGISIDTGSFSISTSGDYYAIYWEKATPALLKNFTLTITAGGNDITVRGYSFVIDGSSYHNTYASSGYYDGDEINNIYPDTSDTAFWSTMQTIILLIAIPSLMGIAYFAAKANKNRKRRKSDHMNDIFRTPTIGGNQ